MALKIDKGILGAFLMLVGIVGVIGTLYFLLYIYGITLGTVFAAVQNTTVSNDVVNDTFTANASTAQSLAHGNVTTGTISIYNNTPTQDEFTLSNFTIDYGAGTVLLVDYGVVPNGTALAANYSYVTRDQGPIPLTPGTRTFLTNTESSFFTTAGLTRNGAQFAGGLIVVAVVLIVFGFILRRGKGSGKDDDDGLDY